jgi:alkylation response protein AidB-like acyl-CoA dehydrogenase
MISFQLSEDQAMVQETVRKFALEELRPRCRVFEKEGVPEATRKKLHDLGVTLVDVPEALGGSGLGAFTAALVHEELAFGDPGAAVAAWSPHWLPHALLELASEEQAKRLLARFVSGAKLGAVAWSEGLKGPEEGFTTTAREEGGGWRLDGEKAFVVNGGRADLYVVFAQIDPAVGWKGIGAFAVEASEVKEGTRHQWLGLEAVHASTITLAGARGERLAGPRDPVTAARRFFARVSLLTAARQVGLARASYETALAYTQDRVAFGKPVAHFQAVSFNLAELATDVDTARWMVWRAAVSLDKDSPDAFEHVAKAAAQANQVAWRVADDAVQLHGGAGFVQDYPVEKWLRDTKALAMCAPSDQQHQLVAAAAAIGKPEEFGDALPVSWIQPVVT